MTIADLSRFYGPDYTQPGDGGDGVGPEYSNWDAQSTTACYCDQGFFGADCSNREWATLNRPKLSRARIELPRTTYGWHP